MNQCSSSRRNTDICSCSKVCSHCVHDLSVVRVGTFHRLIYIFPVVQIALSFNFSFRSDCQLPVLWEMAKPHFKRRDLMFQKVPKNRPVTMREMLKGISVVCQEMLHPLKAWIQWYTTVETEKVVHSREPLVSASGMKEAGRNPPLCPGIPSKRALSDKVLALENKSRIPLRLGSGTY